MMMKSEMTLRGQGLKRIDYLWGVSAALSIAYAFMVPFLDYAVGDVLINLASGYAVSIFFYFLLVWYPERKKRARIKKSIIKHYAEFRERILQIIVWASRDNLCYEEMRELLIAENFNEYYSVNKQEKWYAFMNGLNAYYVGELAVVFECFRFEVNYVLDSIDIEDEEVFDFMKSLSRITREMMSKKADYTDQKTLSNFIHQFFSNFSLIHGKLDYDPTLRLLERI